MKQNVSTYLLVLDTRDEHWKEDARMAVKYRVKFKIARYSLEDVNELDELFKQSGYFYRLDEATNAMYCDPGKPPILPVRKSEQLFPPNSKQGLRSRLPSQA
jgi:hypothetical protein